MTLILFFLSGFSGLVYQVLWLRLLGLQFGVTAYAATAVLTCFMGGLAIGSLLADKIASHTDKPLMWYGFLEIGVGITALVGPPSIYALIFLSILMGASFPLIVKSLQKPALAYGINTAGAIAGASVTGFYLIGNVGMQISFWIAATLNIIVGLVALWQAKRQF